MKTVSFTRMEDGSEADYALLSAHEKQFACELPSRIMTQLAKLKNSLSGYKVDRLDHSLQCASRAERSGADVDWIKNT